MNRPQFDILLEEWLTLVKPWTNIIGAILFPSIVFIVLLFIWNWLRSKLIDWLRKLKEYILEAVPRVIDEISLFVIGSINGVVLLAHVNDIWGKVLEQLIILVREFWLKITPDHGRSTALVSWFAIKVLFCVK